MSIVENIKETLIEESEFLIKQTKVKITANKLNRVTHLKASVPLSEDLKIIADKVINEINNEPSFGIFQIHDGFLNSYVCIVDEIRNKDELIDALVSDLSTILSVIKWEKEAKDGK